jgi:hypothetical protein
VYCEVFGFAKLPFSLIPKLLIPPERSAIFFPDFSGAHSNAIFIGSRQSKRPQFQFFRQPQYPLRRFRIVNHPGQVAVLLGFSQNTGDDPFLVHGDPPEAIRALLSNVGRACQRALLSLMP